LYAGDREIACAADRFDHAVVARCEDAQVVPELGDRDDVARRDLVDRRLLAPPQREQLVQAVPFAGALHPELLVDLEAPAEQPQHVDAADVGVGEGLEHVGHGGPVGGQTVRDRGWGRILDQEPQQRLDALLVARGATQDREQGAVGDVVRDVLDQLLGRRHLALEVALEQVVVVLGDRLDQLLVVVVGGVAAGLGDRDVVVVAVVLVHGDLVQHVDDAVEAVVDPQRDVDRVDAVAVEVDQLGVALLEAGTFEVELVEEHDPGDATGLAHAPQLGVLGLDPDGAVDHEDGGVGASQRRVGVADRLGAARGVQHVELVAAELEAGHGDRQRVAAVVVLGLVVHRRAPVERAAGVPGGAQHRLDQRRLARARVTEHHHVPDPLRGDDRHPPTSSSRAAPTIGVSRSRRAWSSGGGPQR
jgi:hypothetical protein